MTSLRKNQGENNLCFGKVNFSSFTIGAAILECVPWQIHLIRHWVQVVNKTDVNLFQRRFVTATLIF